jgi:dTDP-4-amino-4,6-dideoxygalactose transaminase
MTAVPSKTFLKRFFGKMPRARLYGHGFALFISFLRSVFAPLRRGHRVEEFEAAFGDKFGFKHCHTASTARVCLYLALKSLDLPKGSEVLMTPVTIADMVNMIRVADLEPTFVDIEMGSYNVDIDHLNGQITPETKVLFVTHLMGLVPNMEAIRKIADDHGILVIEDFSQNFGSTFEGSKIGTMGVASIASVSMMKTVCCYIGGIFCTNDPDLSERFKAVYKEAIGDAIPRKIVSRLLFKNCLLQLALSRLGFSLVTYYAVKLLTRFSGKEVSNYQRANVYKLANEPDIFLRTEPPQQLLFGMSDVQARLALRSLEGVDAGNRRRMDLVGVLYDSIDTRFHARLPRPHDWDGSVFWRMGVLVDDPVQFREFMFESYIDTGYTNLFCCTDVPEFREFRSPTPTASRIISNVVMLPVHSTYSESDMRWIGHCVNQYLSQHEADDGARTL